ncbi:IS200/IS605 family IS1341 subgroup transposase [Nostoc sphaeroides CCNUC1]|uniref:IS200/IS605 family IS1341 subgroup transposase n=1 Tax=Nostoc sphaeroides CCNUC1 TaxID=2653204 RepID=A0A5P8VVQ1_9NOSO|nr:IS200/IS605 family IS1341 subgroup transposase [Nostoc sphaeroides CCNUC1]
MKIYKAKASLGHKQSNATGVGTSTLVGANLAFASSDGECRIPDPLGRGVSTSR